MVVLSVVLVAVLLSIEVVKVSASVVRVVVSFTVVVVETGTVVVVNVSTVVEDTGGASTGISCRAICPTPHSAHTNTKTATVADSHRLSVYLGVGTTRFSLSGVIQ